MKRLRAALDDDTDSPRFIETLPRVGYRFVAQVGESGGAAALTSPPQIPTDSFTRRAVTGLVQAVQEAHRSRARWRIWAVAAITVIALAALSVALNVRGWRYRLFTGPGVLRIRSIAVLPLVNLSGNPEQDYFAEGMTDALITELGKISALRVISRQSVMRYRGSQKPLAEIARELQVDGLVEGSVQRSGDRVRVTLNLIDAAADQHLWAEMYDRDLPNVLAIQSDITQAIAQQIRVKLTPREEAGLAPKRRVNPDAYQLYLKGRYFAARVNEANLRKSIEFYEQALQEDPTYAAAHVGLGESYGQLAYIGALPVEEGNSRMKAAATKALEIDETLGEPHAALGSYNLYYRWDGPAAEREFKRSIELSPNYPDGHAGYADYLGQVGLFDEAITEKRRALELDPLAPVFSRELAWMFLYARHYDQAIEQLKKTLELDPNSVDAHLAMGLAYLQKGMLPEAISETEKGQALWPNTAYPAPSLGYVYARAGKKKDAQEILDQLSKGDRPRAYQIATIYMALGEGQQTLSWLEKAYGQRSSFLRWLKVDPRFDPLRSDSRFADLLRRVGLPP
jgi:TolB-like protein/Flp pilus assembly protein TadD